MNELIEEYLRNRGLRYFRGHHDDEYFYLLDTAMGSRHLRLHVHLAVCGAGSDAAQISITPDRYYPAAHGDSLQRAVASWNAECHAVGALVQKSCDPTLVGVTAGSCHSGSDGLDRFVENSETAAVELFGRLSEVAAAQPPTLRNAG